MKKLISALVLAVVSLGPSQAASVNKPVTGASKVSDSQIEQNIRAKFAKSKINSEHFTVTVQNGIAKIDGKTNVIQHKGVATRLAKSGGATSVQNRIQISEAAKEKAVAKLTQARSGETEVAKATVVTAAKPK